MPDPEPLPALQTPWGVFSPGSVPNPVSQSTPQVAIPDHTLLRQIGQGAYGEVWLARNALGQYRAVKILHRRSFSDDRPFDREFAGMQRFEPVSRSHESQLNILHVGRGPDHFYYVMELADDQGTGPAIDEASYSPRTLRSELLFRGRLPVDECLRIGLALTTALGHLHRHGLVHRDIKPSNIVFVNGIPKLADIGLVAVAERTMSFVGTEGYLPPEGPGTVQADLFSLGKVLYEISSGNDRQQFPELPTNVAELPDRLALAELNEVLVRACAPDARQRYQTAAEMHADLALLQSGGSVARQRRLAGHLRFVQRAGALVTALAVVIAAGWAWQARQTGLVREYARRAGESEQAARERLYAADINLAFQALRDDNLRLAQSLLQNHVPQPGQPDLRGFEWRYLWQKTRSEELLTLPGQSTSSRVLALSPDGRQVAVGGFDLGCIRLLDVPQRRVLATLQDTNAMMSLAYSPDGRLLVSGSASDVRLWDPRSFAELRRLTNAAAPAVFSPDGRFLLTGRGPWNLQAWDETKELLVWDAATWTILDRATFPVSGQWSGSRDLYLQVAFGADSRQVAVLTGATARLVSCPELKEKCVVPEDLPESSTSRPFLALSPDNRTLALPSPRGYGVRLWDLAENRELRILPGHADHIFSARFSPDGRWLATGSPDQTIKLWQVATGELLHTFRGQADEVADVAFSADGNRLASLGITESVVKLWDARGRPRPELLPPGLWPQGFDPGGRLVVLGRRPERESMAFDPTDSSVIPTPVPRIRSSFPVANKLHSLSPDGRFHGLWNPRERRLEVWDRRDGTLRCTVPSLVPIFSFDRRGALFSSAMTNSAGEAVVGIRELETGGLRWVAGGFSGYPNLFPTSEGDHVVTQRDDQMQVARVGKDGLNPVLTLTVPIFLSSAAISPDGRLLATAVGDITLRTLPEGRSLGVLTGHTRKGVHLAFSPDSRTIASIADDHTTRLWHVATQRELLRFPATTEDRDLFQVEFSPDGRGLACYRHNGTNAVTSLYFAPSFAEIAVAEGGDYRSLAGEDAPTWHAVSRDLLRQGRLPEAWEACSRAGELAEARDEVAWWLRPLIQQHRVEVLRRLGRTGEAGRENLRLLKIPERDPATPHGAIDLSAFYNEVLAWHDVPPEEANDLRELPTGLQHLGGTAFDVRGVIVTRAHTPEEGPSIEPPHVEGIRLDRRLSRLHFLHMASGDSRAIQTGDRVGHYRIHYADGRSVELPLRYNVDLSDYWELDHLPQTVPEAVVAWRGQNPRSRADGRFIRLFKRTWENPYPEIEVTHLEFVAALSVTHPWLIALTAE